MSVKKVKSPLHQIRLLSSYFMGDDSSSPCWMLADWVTTSHRQTDRRTRTHTHTNTSGHQ